MRFESVGCELLGRSARILFYLRNNITYGRAFEINKIEARVLAARVLAARVLAARCPALYSIAAQRCRYEARPYNAAEAKRQCDVSVRVQHAASPMLGVNNKENRLL